MGFSSTIRKVWTRAPEAPCIEFEGRWRPWTTVSATADAIEEFFTLAGVPSGAAVGLIARNRAGPVAALAALLGLGRCVVMIYSAQSSAAIAADIRRLNLAAVIADCCDWAPEVVQAAQAVGSAGLGVSGEHGEPTRRVQPLCLAGSGPFHLADPGIALELLSSGTTGPPKRVPLSASAFEQAAADAVKIYGSSAATPPANLVCHPISNIAGVTFLMPMLFCGQPTCVMERFELSAWIDAVRRHRPARVSLPPPLIRQILEQSVAPDAFVGLEAIGVGAAMLDPQLQEAFETRYGVPLLVSYGATEFGGVVANWTPDLHRDFSQSKRGSVGRARPGVSLRVADLQTGAPLAVEMEGVLEAKVDRLSQEWIRTTDLASIDADGFVYLHGRADQAINRGGFKISPDKVAAALRSHEHVLDAAVVGMPDPRLGATPVAAVELAAGAKIDADDLMKHVRAALLSYEAPTAIHVFKTLPRNASMKVDLAALKRMLSEAGA
jgi:acyl-coenzyme A synthetase/AMP-(fatty) acid ligase